MKVKMKVVWRSQATQVMVVTREQEEREGQGDKSHRLATLDTAASEESECTGGDMNLGTDNDFGQETAGGKCPQGWVIKLWSM